jgi:tRNA(Arg) A34 adenosine deaminase TadA
MKCIGEVARREREKRKEQTGACKRRGDEEEKGYLCKEFDLYIVNEPCVM